ncbi:fatty acid desaturase [Pseudoalteromonas sp. JBTF-M23]|uniref:Fatty acid desaturase n=1 Tax=Pseudoalteromonas caenipelagi TaxID=2726988 RepID=A0A849VC12_9GAMM|nr:fatty acid desaturase [Pseudoalteromonas caenipelagi]NOU50330.1 fatty acid desaturase [Pseudoalteromonas caenipelagi]
MTTVTTRNNIQHIVQEIKLQERLLRQRYTFLKYQDQISVLILLLSFVGMVGIGTLYVLGEVTAWTCIIFAAIFASISHELEHDLIHKQYFKFNTFAHNAMLFIVWLMRPNTINPWYRRRIHLHHHKTSGSTQDIEERLVGNGISNPFIRVIVICDGLLGLLLMQKRYRQEVKGFSFFSLFNSGFPITTCYFAILYSALLFHGVNLLSTDVLTFPHWLVATMDYVDILMVVLILPNVLRSICLNFITSSMHYYGGVSNVLEQTHVLNHWVMLPFQLFCFNFGATHSIHHFVPNQPFYIRQLIAAKVLPLMKRHGVNFNDFKSLKNANLYT